MAEEPRSGRPQEPDDREPRPERHAEPQAATPVGDGWGDPVTPERAGELKALADQQREWAAAPDHQGRESYFQGVRLTGADVFWLAAYALAGPDGDVAAAQERLRTARDRNEHIDLSALHLEGAFLDGAYLEGAFLQGVHLEGADLSQAHLEGAVLQGANLEGAVLQGANLEGAVLQGAHLQGAYLRAAHLEQAVLREAHLETLYVNPP